MKVDVKNNNVVKAYKRLKKKLHYEGVIREIMERQHYIKPSDARRKKKQLAIRRQQKEHEKQQKLLFG